MSNFNSNNLYSDYSGIYYWNLLTPKTDPEKVYLINWLRVQEGDEC